ncbi:MAG: hypothetical protein LBI05_05610 [Planctomycetaceae bacterium]|nr:hypothetical protein [Planctomycetaceae bacterium]
MSHVKTGTRKKEIESRQASCQLQNAQSQTATGQNLTMFAFTTCQIGAESALKREFARLVPHVRAAFARPGFVSFKTEVPLPNDLANRSVFARTFADSLGKIETDSQEQLVREVWKIVSEHHLFVNRVHVFRCDWESAEEHDSETPLSPELVDLHRNIVSQSPTAKFLGADAGNISHPAKTGETILDVVMIDPNRYFVGTHTITERSPIHTRYSGGLLPITPPTDAVSRAYLKFNEGFLWSGFVPGKEATWLDIGASPGGCSQFLLQRGFRVLGVDPGEMHPVVLNHPRFTHIRARIRDTKRSLFSDVQWITADMNVAPNYTLEVLEEIVGKASSVRGILFTLKLIRWNLADSLPMFVDRIRTWGFPDIRIKQLVFNRQEVMVAMQR